MWDSRNRQQSVVERRRKRMTKENDVSDHDADEY
jgi:hypothetical protein